MLTRRLHALALAAALALTASAALAAPAMPTEQPGDMSLGSPKAKVRVVEYASLSCPHCARFNAEVFPAFKAKYVDGGKVRYTLREMLTPPAEVAAAGFLLARCAGPDKYYKVVDAVFRSQDRWDGDILPVFMGVAKGVGLTEPQFNACLKDEAGLKALNARVKAAIDVGVDSTPTFFVNGKKF